MAAPCRLRILASNPDFDSNTVIAAADPQITMKNNIVNAKAYDTIECMKIEKENRPKRKPNDLTASVTATGKSVNRMKRMISRGVCGFRFLGWLRKTWLKL
ncbi:hypothetical protein L1987_11134 [Smallanthus sonchifolius]|uniref:Uncharacterized protein n=1 Tax=Smallanthus sonchifolius TaxID=185202 RepID=A0ACB9JA20_9ASTR|nr:hypothetical protein L1987_11134 [Smallanthus sonchifolius]